ncbi:E3 ubiquitin-protein ligase AMFR [Bombus vancouverensis nearcticus]|uniref:E3 ubiquitin-protein ligase AMFR-like n=1 Tax=Bombus bifarius TaxID=103933 RepID=A0A6P8NJW2_9HYME|nr:E3 ubiquitin-protein ligase AMFR-like [Bombus vancouverensis nearcticus]XP_033320288.1 E3 ubiquitin-protein ligase AMFR-like [Bombus bifarius]XP_033320289.1 E3 ubiquitin-protein ligase AMFR-like [Bombus bifarius]
MPIEFLDRLPMPNLRLYTAISFGVLSCSIYYAVQIIKDPAWKITHTYVDSENDSANNIDFDPRDSSMYLKELLECMLDEPICIWTLINMAYCVLILLGKTIQKLVFAELRVSERQHLKDKFWNFVFYKFIFVFGVLNVQYMDEVLLWWAWFTALGFLSLLSQLCKDRFEYLSFSPTTPGWSHAKLLGLLATILALSSFMLLLCTAAAFFFVSFNTFVFTAAECILLGVRTIHVMVRYIIHLYDTRGAGTSSQRSWDKRGPLTYYTDLTAELIVLAVDFLHHVHMLLWSNIFLSMASLVICMQLRYLFYEIQRKITKHRNYLAVLNHMEQNYPMASQEELAENSDNCAICWEKMETARKLPCAHLFHNSCLQSWLEQDTSCPTCRLALNMQPSHLVNTQELSTELQTPARRNENHFFHFDGSRYVSWLPSFSVEVSHNRLRGNISTITHNNSQMDTMIRQVQQLFPQFPRNLIVEDLRGTRSIEWTVANILDGVLMSPHHIIEEPQLESVLQIHTSTTETSVSLNTPSMPLPSDPRFDIPLADSGEEPSSLGGRFSKSSSEREQILQRRKELLRLTAKEKYLEKCREKHGADESVSNATS